MGLNLRHLLRRISPKTLRPFLASLELPPLPEKSWESDEPELARALFEHICALPDESRTAVFGAAQRVKALACERGRNAILNAARNREEIATTFRDLNSDCERSAWTYTADRSLFQAAEELYFFDDRAGGQLCRSFHGPKGAVVSRDTAVLDAFQSDLQDFFRRRDGSGRCCSAEVVERFGDGSVQVQSWGDRNFVWAGMNGWTRSPTMPRRKEPRIPDAILDQLLAGADPKTAFDPNGLLDDLKKALAERALNAEMDHHLAGEGGTGNGRNGYGHKTVVTDTGKLDLQIPRDRQASFDPQLIAKYQRRFPGFDDKVISMYARGMSTREIVGHLRELYGIEVSPDLISAVTDAVLDEIAAWQVRPLEPVYPLIFFDALRVKIREEALVRNKAIHVALGVRADGTKEILGLWIEQTEGAKFWLRVMSELKNRGVEDVLIAVVDGLKGFPEAITAVFPDAMVQTCIVHLLRHSLEFVAYKDRKAVAAALKEIYRAVDATAAEAALSAFEEGPWGGKYAAIAQSWRRAWGEVVPFYAFPAEVRRLLYTTNAIEALNSKLRRAVRARGHFPTDEAALKLLFLVLNRSEKEWTMPAREWWMAKAQFAILFGERFTRAMA